ncbi:interferon-induced protein 44 [Dasypus novemcinctus]|uniref:interferon-induced protein 44 n=1 Tax=Dasypus novemcinctus TaxID=9361 RepID=UPI00265E32BC|nr:interferon-induced protein 44 [Dasypus novemcinctus]XP_058159287.1 interferon-induced protein 44 [Dasypus novemcinctus]
MAVTTRLTWLQKKKLQNCFGEKKFSLLYKATVHGFSCEDLLKRCSNQGPTILVTYSEDYVIGAYMGESYNTSQEKKGSIILFAFQDIENSEFDVRLFEFRDAFHREYNILCYGRSNFRIYLNRKRAEVNVAVIEELGLPQRDNTNIQECEVFRCEDLLNQRTIDGINVLRENLLSDLKTYKLYENLVHQARILLLGPFGAGKSSFFNSVKSVFRGHITNQAPVGFNTTGISEQYRIYSITDGKNGGSLPFILCDSMGLGVKEGLCMDDIPYILQGHVPDRYKFNSIKPITPSHHDYIDSPLLKDRIHCVAFVFDANSVADFSSEMVANIKRIQKELIKYGMVHVALLTHVDDIDLITKGDLIDIYRCVPVKSKIEAVHTELGFPFSNILVVSNYTSEWELDPIKDVLILSALKQMLRIVDDFLEDLPLATDIKGKEEPNVQKEERNE